jgi:hypothetical protein
MHGCGLCAQYGVCTPASLLQTLRQHQGPCQDCMPQAVAKNLTALLKVTLHCGCGVEAVRLTGRVAAAGTEGYGGFEKQEPAAAAIGAAASCTALQSCVASCPFNLQPATHLYVPTL